MPDQTAILKAMYERFNTRDIEGVLATVDEDVEWANGMDGGHVHGKAEVREYWTRQWARVSPRVHPISFERRRDGRIAVEARLELFDLAGHRLTSIGGLRDDIVRHVYEFSGSLVRRFDIEEG